MELNKENWARVCQEARELKNQFSPIPLKRPDGTCFCRVVSNGYCIPDGYTTAWDIVDQF